MANKSGILAGEAYVALDLDDEEYKVAMKLALQRLKQFGDSSSLVVRATNRISRAFLRVASSARVVGRAMKGVVGSISKFSRLVFDTLAPSLFFLGASAAAMGASMLGAIRPAAKAFANLEDVVSRFRIVFGENAAAAEKWARSFAKSIEFAPSTILDVMGRFQALFTTQGISGDIATTASKGLAELVPNLASFFEQRPDEVITRLFSGLVGEMEAVRRLSIDLSAQAVNLELDRFGIDPKTATQGQKALARYNLIVQQTGLAQEDLRKTSASLANTVVRLSEAWKRTQETVGAALAPALTTIAELAATVLKKLEPLVETKGFQRLATQFLAVGAGLTVLGTAAVTIAPLVTAFGSLASFATAAAGAIGTGLTVAVAGLGVALSTATKFAGKLFEIFKNSTIATKNIGSLKGIASGISGVFAAGRGRVADLVESRRFKGLTPTGQTLASAFGGIGTPKASGGFVPKTDPFSKLKGPSPFRTVNTVRGLSSAEIAKEGLFGTKPGSTARGGSFVPRADPFSKLFGGTPTQVPVGKKLVAGASGLGEVQLQTKTVVLDGRKIKSSNFITRQPLAPARASQLPGPFRSAPGKEFFDPQKVFQKQQLSAIETTRRANMAAGQQVAVMDKLRSAFDGTSRTVKASAVNVGRANQKVGMLSRATAFLGGSLPKVGQLFAGVVKALGSVSVATAKFYAIWRGVTSAFRPIGEVLSQSFEGLILAGKKLLATFAGVGKAFFMLSGKISAAFSEILNSLISGDFERVGRIAFATFDLIKTAGKIGLTAIGGAFDELFGAIMKGMDGLITSAQYLAFIVANPLKAVAIGEMLSADADNVRTNTMDRLAQGYLIRSGKMEDMGEFVLETVKDLKDGGFRARIQNADGEQRFEDIRGDEALRIRQRAEEEAASFMAQETLKRMKKALGGAGGLQATVGESFEELAQNVVAQFTDSGELKGKLKALNDAIAFRGDGAGRDIPGANPQAVEIQKKVEGAAGRIAEAVQAGLRIAQTASISDSSARSRFGSGDREMTMLEKQQLAMLKIIANNTKEPGLQGANL